MLRPFNLLVAFVWNAYADTLLRVLNTELHLLSSLARRASSFAHGDGKVNAQSFTRFKGEDNKAQRENTGQRTAGCLFSVRSPGYRGVTGLWGRFPKVLATGWRSPTWRTAPHPMITRGYCWWVWGEAESHRFKRCEWLFLFYSDVYQPLNAPLTDQDWTTVGKTASLLVHLKYTYMSV